MKKITLIHLENYRAYYGKYAPISLPKGENVLIYGENGSGKSSLYKSLKDFFASANITNYPFVNNHYQVGIDGYVRLVFSTVNPATNEIIAGSEHLLEFGNSASTHDTIPFVKDTDRIKGFLDYRSLLEIYNHKEKKPNLFKLIVFNILGSYVNRSAGTLFTFPEKWRDLNKRLITDSRTREDRSHKYALPELPTFQLVLEDALKKLFRLANTYLGTYFSEQKIQIGYILQKIDFDYGNRHLKWDWRIINDLRLEVFQNGIKVKGDYSDILNEARLAAFSVCLYLASLKNNPSTFEYKMLFLDDIFVGLDTGNRLPILQILQNEFQDFQIFISTYDRHWFEVAKRHFENTVGSNWKMVELYVGKEQAFEKPIIVMGESYIEKAIQYLHDRTKPDYPAAANYFRKALEEIIPKYLLPSETVDGEFAQIPAYKLTKWVSAAKKFLDKTYNDISIINDIKTLLPTILHPLSHHEITAPIYKTDLVAIQGYIIALENYLFSLNIITEYICCLEANQNLKYTFIVDAATNHICYYELKTKETLLKDSSNRLSKVYCVAEKYYGHNGSTPYPVKFISTFNYSSLENAYDTIHAALCSSPIGAFPKIPDYLDAIEYFDGANWQPIKSKI